MAPVDPQQFPGVFLRPECLPFLLRLLTDRYLFLRRFDFVTQDVAHIGQEPFGVKIVGRFDPLFQQLQCLSDFLCRPIALIGRWLPSPVIVTNEMLTQKPDFHSLEVPPEFDRGQPLEAVVEFVKSLFQLSSGLPVWAAKVGREFNRIDGGPVIVKLERQQVGND
jgi:hypothetical protein